jgi:hypothetical protein
MKLSWLFHILFSDYLINYYDCCSSQTIQMSIMFK